MYAEKGETEKKGGITIYLDEKQYKLQKSKIPCWGKNWRKETPFCGE